MSSSTPVTNIQCRWDFHLSKNETTAYENIAAFATSLFDIWNHLPFGSLKASSSNGFKNKMTDQINGSTFFFITFSSGRKCVRLYKCSQQSHVRRRIPTQIVDDMAMNVDQIKNFELDNSNITFDLFLLIDFPLHIITMLKCLHWFWIPIMKSKDWMSI